MSLADAGASAPPGLRTGRPADGPRTSFRLRTVVRQIVQLMAICIAGPGGKLGLIHLAVVVVLAAGGIWVGVRLIAWSGDFYNALQRVDVDAVVTQVGVFAALILTSAGLHLAQTYVRQILEMRWRRVLTEHMLGLWLSDKAHWHLHPSLGGDIVENPDQRISEDCRFFVDTMLEKVLGFFIQLGGLVSYLTVLWGLATFALSFTVLGVSVEIPRYMVWAAPIYVALATGLTHWLGAPLQRLAYEQERREADFRFALARLREASSAVALLDGEPSERRLLSDRFSAIAENWYRLLWRELILGLFTRPYFQTVLRIPMFFALPAFLAGRVTLGGLMQLASAFQNVVTTLSWFIFNYPLLARLAAAVTRLDDLRRAAAGLQRLRPGPERVGSADGALRLTGLRLETPDGRRLLSIDALTIAPGETVWLKGVSGLGKSTLVKALAGLWPHGSGQIALPAGPMLCLPQQPYLPLGTLATAASYPLDPAEVPRERLEELLVAVGLEKRRHRLDAEDGASGLSVGEQQRLALLRVLLIAPDWLVLDEATSALDVASEEALHRLIRERLSRTGIVVIAHREPKGMDGLRTVELAPIEPSPGRERVGSRSDPG